MVNASRLPVLLATLLASSSCVSHYRIHPREDPPPVKTWSDEVTRDGLRVRPVLLIHGEKDKSAGIGESRRLEQRLRELGREVELLEVESAGHIFNFRDTEKAEATWPIALSWLDRHLQGD